MKQVERNIFNALIDETNGVFGNTAISWDNGTGLVNLHGHIISKITPEEVMFDFCGYDTNITRSRMNLVADIFLDGCVRKVKGINKLFIGEDVIELKTDKPNLIKRKI